MTSRDSTNFLSLPDDMLDPELRASPSDWAYRLLFGAIGWPWLAFSLWGGTKASKRRLLDRVGLRPDALPNLGSWKADTGFLHRIVDAVEELRPQTVVELGAGASTLVCAKALMRNGGGRVFSFDQHETFVAATAEWLASEGCKAELHYAPLTASVEGWPGRWYDLPHLPEEIDLLIIDGPPWAVHPYVRGAAECLFDRLSPGGMVLLDDAARPGERVVAKRWQEHWPKISFARHSGSTKGTLIGRKHKSAEIVPLPGRRRGLGAKPVWSRAAAAMLMFVSGWIGHDIANELSPPAQAAEFIDEADASYATSIVRGKMRSQIESTELDRAEIASAVGILLPAIPAGWQVGDVQVYPSELGMSVALVLRTDAGETVSLFATRAETPAEKLPLLETRRQRAIAYWENGPNAYALTGRLASDRMLALAASLAE